MLLGDVETPAGSCYPASLNALAISFISQLTAKSCWLEIKKLLTSLRRFCSRPVLSRQLFTACEEIFSPRNEVSNGKEPLDLVLGSDAGSVVLPPARRRRE